MAERGLVLLEAVVALGLIAILILPIGAAIASRAILAQRNQQRLQALTVAQSQLEYLIAAPQEATAASSVYVSYPFVPQPGDPTPQPRDTFQLTYEVTPFPPASGLSQLTVQVYWPPPAFKNSLTLATLIPSGG